MKNVLSIKPITKRYSTGEEPVLVACDDQQSYICKYSRYSGSANKLLCEFIGAFFAKEWSLCTPEIAIVRVRREHVPNDISPSFFSHSVLGSHLQGNVVDITPSSIPEIPSNESLCRQLIQIALFDFWMANEDRNDNNANLMFDYVRKNFVTIDFGCTFNTATFDFPLSQLTETDSILSSYLFRQINKEVCVERVYELAGLLLEENFPIYVQKCQAICKTMVSQIPLDWEINCNKLEKKIEELFDPVWIKKVKDNFITTLQTTINNE